MTIVCNTEIKTAFHCVSKKPIIWKGNAKLNITGLSQRVSLFMQNKLNFVGSKSSSWFIKYNLLKKNWKQIYRFLFIRIEFKKIVGIWLTCAFLCPLSLPSGSRAVRWGYPGRAFWWDAGRVWGWCEGSLSCLCLSKWSCRFASDRRHGKGAWKR